MNTAANTPSAAGGIRIEGLRKVYGKGDNAVEALKDVNMVVAPGEVVGLVGPSGSGKSTLLKCLGAIIEPTSGRMTLGNDLIYDNGWRVPDLRALRRDRIGFIFQAPYLIPFLDVTDNVALLPMLAGVGNATARATALELLTALDVHHRAKAEPSQLSGGEQQRVSIARALANRPPVILADEPTAPLDSKRPSLWSRTTRRSFPPSSGSITSGTGKPLRKPGKVGCCSWAIGCAQSNPTANPLPISTIKTATMSSTALKVTFVSKRFPKYTPRKADPVATITA